MTAGDAWAAVLLGVVEGATEFLPVSSTGHLIVASRMLGLSGPAIDTFIVFIQLGAILAVCWHYRGRLRAAIAGFPSDSHSRSLALNLAVAFAPAALAGLLLHSLIKEHLFRPATVAWALIAGGAVILLIEMRRQPARVAHMDDIGWRDALKVGLAQILSLFPGVSRAGATIMGGMLSGMSRQAATEFSFFLAIPVIAAAACYSLFFGGPVIAINEAGFFALGFASAFASALLAVRWLLAYVSANNFKVFGWYRIIAGIAVLALAHLGQFEN